MVNVITRIKGVNFGNSGIGVCETTLYAVMSPQP